MPKFSAKRDVLIDLGHPWNFVTIERSMLPLKFYHDFNCEVQSYSYAFGPCWEPVIAQCHLSKYTFTSILMSWQYALFSVNSIWVSELFYNHHVSAFEKIIAPSRDPSPPLPFWDKMRLLLHGRLTMVVQQLTVLLHASLDPYNTTEEMELTWNQVVMDWTNGIHFYARTKNP